jgi:hypothetical protein
MSAFGFVIENIYVIYSDYISSDEFYKVVNRFF